LPCQAHPPVTTPLGPLPRTTTTQGAQWPVVVVRRALIDDGTSVIEHGIRNSPPRMAPNPATTFPRWAIRGTERRPSDAEQGRAATGPPCRATPRRAGHPGRPPGHPVPRRLPAPDPPTPVAASCRRYRTDVRYSRCARPVDKPARPVDNPTPRRGRSARNGGRTGPERGPSVDEHETAKTTTSSG